MPAKPYSPSHIAAVAGGFTELRLSGSVKGMLVEMRSGEVRGVERTMVPAADPSLTRP